MSAHHALEKLAHCRPEWKPWLTVLAAALENIDDHAWDAVVPSRGTQSGSDAPKLANAEVCVDRDALERVYASLARVVEKLGAPGVATLGTSTQVDALELFTAALNHDSAKLATLASTTTVHSDMLHALAAMVAMPFLHACNRQWVESQPAWSRGYCPVCGAWPAFAEVRGVERSRYLRCGNCGGEWEASCLSCAYCGTTDHDELASLVPEDKRSAAVIEVCRRCLGYLKVFTRLQGTEASQVMVDDLASAELDVAAIERGYKRVRGGGYALEVQVAEKRASRD
ncbi:MAG: formate dehydrogenase accessory protein [Betaproteobacteria bacterium]|nr:formate dehydrogenase accessory protein [Betaproteobacteria bacterium]